MAATKAFEVELSRVKTFKPSVIDPKVVAMQLVQPAFCHPVRELALLVAAMVEEVPNFVLNQATIESSVLLGSIDMALVIEGRWQGVVELLRYIIERSLMRGTSQHDE